METRAISSANFLDILFDGRNKDYGAYDLRKTYEKRIGIALAGTAIFILLFTMTMSWKITNQKSMPKDFDTDVNLSELIPKTIIPPRPVQPPAVHVRTVSFVPPLIVPDVQVTKPSVENNNLEDARIDSKQSDGVNDKGLLAPVEIPESQVAETPAKKEDAGDVKFTAVEIEAKFNGNWNAYLKKEIEKNIDELTEMAESGTCIVRFVVSKDGMVSEVEAITMKGSKLAEVAMNAIRKGPRWIPARQNGREVNAYRQQPVSFQINE